MREPISITFTWNWTDGNARASKADLARLKEIGGITVVDFLQDVASISADIYDQSILENVEKCAPMPLLVKRRCGGWLAVSGGNESVKVGVTAETEAGAAELFNCTIRAWRLALAERGSRG